MGRLLEGGDQQLDVMLPAAMADLEGVSSSQLGERFWQLVSARHLRSLDQRRYHANFLFQGRLNFETNQVSRVVQPAPAIGVRQAEPALADHCDQDLA